jgi:hypothetical protein
MNLVSPPTNFARPWTHQQRNGMGSGWEKKTDVMCRVVLLSAAMRPATGRAFGPYCLSPLPAAIFSAGT